MPVKRVDSLDISQDMDFQRRMWTIQRVGWVVMLLLVLAALLGLFGEGILASANAGDPNSPIWAEYPRFARQMAPQELKFHLAPGVVTGGEIQFWIDRDYIDKVDINKIEPEPDQVELTPDQLIYTFKVQEADQPLLVTFQVEPDSLGNIKPVAGLVDGPSLSFNQFIYP